MPDIALQDVTSNAQARAFFANTWPLYVHELCGHGERLYTLDASGQYQPNLVSFWSARVTPNTHLREPRTAADAGQPFARASLLLSAGRPVGFVCIAQRPFRYMPEDAERCLAELFVVHHARGTGAALEGARAALGTAPGARWYLRALRGNQPALRFWTRALPALGASDLVQAEEGEAVSFRFRAPKSL